MAKSKESAVATEAPRKPRLLKCFPHYTVHWPYGSCPPRIDGRENAIVVHEDDPLIDTTGLRARIGDQAWRELELVESDQRHKFGPAPEGAKVSAHNEDYAVSIYRRLGYAPGIASTVAPAATPARPGTTQKEQDAPFVPGLGAAKDLPSGDDDLPDADA